MKKFMLRVMPIVLVAFVVLCNVYAVTAPTGTADQTVTRFSGNLYATITTVIQILAIVAVIFAGLRYMFASADGKADIKQQTVILIVGAILVFAAVPVLNLVQNIANNMIK